MQFGCVRCLIVWSSKCCIIRNTTRQYISESFYWSRLTFHGILEVCIRWTRICVAHRHHESDTRPYQLSDSHHHAVVPVPFECQSNTEMTQDIEMTTLHWHRSTMPLTRSTGDLVEYLGIFDSGRFAGRLNMAVSLVQVSAFVMNLAWSTNNDSHRASINFNSFIGNILHEWILTIIYWTLKKINDLSFEERFV